MPCSTIAEIRVGVIPYSEAAMFSRCAGQTLLLVEEDLYVNGKAIERSERRGCVALVPTNGGRQRVHLTKSEAGWSDARPATDDEIKFLAPDMSSCQQCAEPSATHPAGNGLDTCAGDFGTASAA